MKKTRLFTPGPVMIPENVMLHMAQPIEHHRTQFFRDMLADVTEHLRWLFQTKDGEPLILTGSGTAAGEAALVSSVHKGANKVLNVHGGKFAERWGKVCKALDLEVVEYKFDWGTAADPAAIERMLAEDPKIDTVVAVHSETSTATVNDIAAIGKITQKRGALLIVDCITSCGCIPLKMDEWGVDIAFTGSQKALMLPPGLAIACVSAKAWQRIDAGTSKSFYCDLKAYRKSLRNWESPYTPANTLVLGLQKTLRDMKARGLEAMWKETKMLADATRAAVQAMGLKLYSKSPADSVTALWVPEGVDEAALRKTMRGTHGMQIAGGQDDIKGKVIRIGHMGYVDAFDTLAVIGALELTLKSLGAKIALGSGLKAAQEVFARTL
jgi:aspartate aminotransferase-like enzyme